MSDVEGNSISNRVSLLMYMFNNRRRAILKEKFNIMKERMSRFISFGFLNPVTITPIIRWNSEGQFEETEGAGFQPSKGWKR